MQSVPKLFVLDEIFPALALFILQERRQKIKYFETYSKHLATVDAVCYNGLCILNTNLTYCLFYRYVKEVFSLAARKKAAHVYEYAGSGHHHQFPAGGSCGDAAAHPAHL